MLKQYFTNQTKRTQQLTAIIVVLIVAGIGTYLILGSHAATPYASITADKGTLANGATAQTCAGSSNGSCVVFGGSTSPYMYGVIGSGNSPTTFVKSGITADRIDYLYPSTSYEFQNPATDIANGINNFVVNLNIADSTSTSCVLRPTNCVGPAVFANWAYSIIQAHPTFKYWDVLNEAYFKANIADPIGYGKMYLDLYNDVQGITSGYTKIPNQVLMFNMWGDYYNQNTSSWSQDGNGGGWLHDAVTANPGLANAIANEAVSDHPYDNLPNGNADPPKDPTPHSTDPLINTWLLDGQDESGPYSVGTPDPDNVGSACINGCDQETIEKDYLGTIPPDYITEYGILDATTPSFPNIPTPDCPGNLQGEQAYLLTEAYNVFLSDPHIKGIAWYAGGDDINPSGLLNSDGSPRPSFNALIQSEDLKQHVPSCNGRITKTIQAYSIAQ